MSDKFQKIPEQEDVVFESKSQIVSASAGSGKTTVMIRKVVEHIKAKDCHVDEVLILTYTSAAALEMKKRLVERLKKESSQNEFLQDELDNVQTADVCTIDSFCQKLVKKYFYILNIDPTFSILEAGDQAILQGKAFDQSIQKLKKEDPQDYELLIANLSPSRNEQNIKALVLEIFTYLTSIFDENEFWNKTFDLYDKNKKIAENQLLDYYKTRFNAVKDELNKLLVQAKDFGFVKYVEHINQVLSNIDAFAKAKDFASMLENSYLNTTSVLRVIKDDEIDFKSKISAQKDIFKKLKDEIKYEYIDQQNILNSYDNCFAIVKALKKIYGLFVEKYTQAKYKINTLDFNDVERLAIVLLENKEANDEIKNLYKKIFVDEFQDANRVQEKIIFLLDNNNLFFVGDTKQSIYAFRQSEPDIFLEVENKFSNSKNACAKKLNCNFRTNKNILYFANYIFNQIMTIHSCGLDYQKNSQFDPRANFEDVLGETCVDFDILLENEQKQQDLPITKVYSVKENAEDSSSLSAYDYESAYICQKITQLLGQDIFDNQLCKTRKINFNDIAILINKRGSFLPTLLKHLTQVGIPYVVNVNDNLEECYDNQVLFSLLKLSQNFQDDYSLYAVLSSYLFDFSDKELGIIKNEYITEKYFYSCVKKYTQLKNALAEKTKNFLQILNNFSFDVKYKGIYFALNKTVKNTNYLLKLSQCADYEQRRTNIQAYINSFADSKYNNDLTEYILYRETAIRQEKVQTEKTFSKAIEITTMHSSKGLEYPVVILPFLNQDYLKSPYTSEIKINKYLGIGVKDFNQEDRSVKNGIFFNACRLKNKNQEIAEKIRLLYVAMTRAKNKLVLIGTAKKDYKKISDNNIFSCNNFLSLLIGSMEENLIEKINGKQEFCCDILNNEKLKLNVVQIGEIIQENYADKTILPKQSELQNIANISNFLQKSTNQTATNIALKNSVSEFAFDDNSSHTFLPKTFNISEHMPNNLSDVGTLYHKVLQVCDFSYINNIQDLISYIECNFSDEEINILKQISYDNIYNNILIVKNLISGYDNILKEQKFVMRTKHNTVVDGGEDCYILIQGIVDLMAVKENQVLLIDYKYTQKDDEYIKQTYQKQLSLYEMALKKRFKGKKINKIIINLRKNSVINM